MRLTQKECDEIVASFEDIIENNWAELRLYGSRVNDALRGGDIDLLLLVEKPALLDALRARKHYLLADIKNRIGDQKIDLTLASPKELEEEAFLKVIYPQSLLIHQFKLA